MNAPRRSVCLIGPGHVASTPRLVKEADALVEAGYRVHVIAGRHFAPVDALDAAILRNAKWTHTRVQYFGGPAATLRKIVRRASRALLRWPAFVTPRWAARALHAETFHLAAVARRQPADLYWGHCLPGLAAAALAAHARKVVYGFDAEDFHEAETHDAMAEPRERIIRAVLLRQFLPGCAAMTASAPLIADAYAERYRIQRPETVLNVFPLAQAPAAPRAPAAPTATRPLRCYWFSQTIGPGRGLEAFLTVLAHLRTSAELHLRGHLAPGYSAALQVHADAVGCRRLIRFHPPAAPMEMARLAADFDLGLSIEQSEPLNHDLCLANKIFIYLLAGIPQFLSRTRAQAALAAELGEAALLGDLDRPAEAARMLDEFFASPARIAAARRAAWELGQRRYCWDVERVPFLDAIAKALP